MFCHNVLLTCYIHRKLITGAGHVVTLCCQEPNMEWTADFVNVGTINNEITVNSGLKEKQVSQPDLDNKAVSDLKLDSVTGALLRGCSQTANVLQLESAYDGSVSQEMIEMDSNSAWTSGVTARSY